MQETLRGKLYDKIAELGPAWFAGERTGGVMLSVVDGVEQLQSFFGQFVPQASVAALTPIAIFAFIVWWDAPVALVMLVAALVTLIAPASFHAIERRTGMARQQAMKGFGSEFLDAVQGLPTLKAFGQSTAYGSRLAERARQLSRDDDAGALDQRHDPRDHRRRNRDRRGGGAGARGVAGVARADVDRGAADRADGRHRGVPAAARSARGAAPGDGRAIGGRRHPRAAPGRAAGAKASPRPGRRATRRTCRSAARPLTRTLSAGGGEGVFRPAMLSPTIEFDDVHFAYPGGRRPAHDGLSFSVAAGEKIGIVGPSGSGKSSVARLLLRLFDPQSGSVRVGGHDLRTLDPDVLRGQIAVVHQDTYLFHGTVEENLLLGKPDATPAELEQAARDANAHEFIRQLPQGYHTIIGERGVNLSGGQRQRLAIARALLRDSPVLILDEALSSVDAENEAVIQQALDRLAQGRTTLILAHRLSSVIGADRILVLDHGRVVESGSHAELIRRDGPYRQLMGAQAEERGDDDLDLATEEFAAARGAVATAPITARKRRPPPRPRPRRSARWRRCARWSRSSRRGGGASASSSPRASDGSRRLSASASPGRWRSRRSRLERRSLIYCSCSGFWRRSPASCTGSNRGWRTTSPTGCSPRCVSTFTRSSMRWRRPIWCGAARAI